MKARSIFGAVILAVIAGGWLLSGLLGRDPEPNPPPLRVLGEQAMKSPSRGAATTVRVRRSSAVSQPTTLKLRGKTESRHTVMVPAQTDGPVEARAVDQGAQVRKGDPLCQLAIEDRDEQVEQSRDALAAASLAYEGALRLQAQGLVEELGIAQAKARLSGAKRLFEAHSLQLAHTSIRAPSDGYVEAVHTEVGDYMHTGDPCVTLLDLDPMLIVAQISELHVMDLELGAKATATLPWGAEFDAEISFIGKRSDPNTRTFRVEAGLPNPDYAVRAGLTTDLQLNLGEQVAHRVTAALLVLDDDGELGIRTVDSRNRVAFHRVQVIHEDDDGIWVTGLPQQASIITVGHEFVAPGELVEVELERPS